MLFLLPVLLSTVASAGAKVNSEVGVSLLPPPNYASAWGSIATAQASPDSMQSIGCRIAVNTTSGTAVRSLSCSARTSTGVTGSCYMNNPPQAIVDLITSLRDTDILAFYWNQSTSTCMEVNVERTSTVSR